MEKGTLVEFKVNGQLRLGVAERPEGKKNWVVIDGNGQSHTLHPRQVTYEVKGGSYSAEDVPAFESSAAESVEPDSLEVAWELLSEEGEATDPPGLALLLFDEQTPTLCYASHRLLSEDKIFFKQKGDGYVPRPKSQVDELLHQIEQEAKRQQEWEGFLARLRQAIAGEVVDWRKSDRTRIETLERYALFGDEAPQKATAHEIIAELGRKATPDLTFELLVKIGLWQPHENLALRRAQLPIEFSDEVMAVMQQSLGNVPPDSDPQRADLTHLKVYTIDDEATREIDDGLSIETLPDGRERLWAHIADPTRWINPGDPLDLEARRRCTTVYLPTGMIPMFPEALATGPMSLRQGEVCCALSFGVVLRETGEIDEYTIQPSLIKPTYRLTYEDVDEMLELDIQAEPELGAIATWVKQRQAWRQAQGAIRIQLPDSAVRVENDGEDITIEVLDNSASRQLVAEMMILTGEVAARYGEENELPIPYRGQPQPELPSDEELMLLPAGWVRDSALRRCMPRSEMGVTPARHATLGLDRYSQVTSPIRRYTDLLAHFQLKAHLRGEAPPFSREEMTQLTVGISNTAYEAVLVERQTKRYWALEYLRRHGDQTWPVLLLRWLRQHESLGLIMFEELGLELPMRFGRSVELGERFQVRVREVDPRHDLIRFDEVAEPVTDEVVA
ncbi:MAG: ribonuclease R family protein [Cyanobacteria bacterium J06627_15]